jgi:hypothetical protein
MMNREDVIAIRRRLLDRGYQPIGVYSWDYPGVPKEMRGKRPSERAWQRTIGMPIYREHASNTGVLTGDIYPLDIDVEDPALVNELVAMAERLFGRTNVRCRQNSPRCLLPYRIEASEPRKLIVPLACGKLEFLGRGQQFVGFGRHPSGADYEWRGDALDQVSLNTLPLIDSASIDAFRSWAEARWPIAEKAKPNGAGRKNGAGAHFRNTCLREDVEAALKALPCDYDRTTWVKLGMSYRAGDGSYAVFLEWSRHHPQYESDSYVRAQWRSFANNHSSVISDRFDDRRALLVRWTGHSAATGPQQSLPLDLQGAGRL